MKQLRKTSVKPFPITYIAYSMLQGIVLPCMVKEPCAIRADDRARSVCWLHWYHRYGRAFNDGHTHITGSFVYRKVKHVYEDR
jgi:hypothetical protein